MKKNVSALTIDVQGFDWAGLVERTLTPPIVPTVHGAADTSNFDQVTGRGWVLNLPAGWRGKILYFIIFVTRNT